MTHGNGSTSSTNASASSTLLQAEDAYETTFCLPRLGPEEATEAALRALLESNQPVRLSLWVGVSEWVSE